MLMKKTLSFLAAALLSVLGASAQMIAYDVATSTTDFNEVTGGTVIDLQGTTGSDLSKTVLVNDKDESIIFNAAEDVSAFPIGFNFSYNGKDMQYFLLGGDGEVILSTESTVSTDVHQNLNTLFSSNNAHDVFGIVMREGLYGLDNTEISYKVEGESGSRVLIIQYKNIGIQGTFNVGADHCGAVASIQYRLYEATGDIEFKLNGFKPEQTGSFNFMRIGLLGDAKDFIQVQAYDGSVVGDRDNSISYSVDNYPADGTTYLFKAPEACQTPVGTISDLVLTSTTSQISGTFTADVADHYLVLAKIGSEITDSPVDKTKYAVGSKIGNSTVIAVVAEGEFSSPNNMEAGAEYNISIVPFNSMCTQGPLYGESFKSTIVTKPAAPASLAVTAVDKNTMTLSVETVSNTTVLVAMTDVQEVNTSDQYLTNGVFGEPTGTYTVGNEIVGGGKVVYVGESVNEINLTELTAGKPYFFRAWSIDANGGYSTEYLDKNEVTAAELPWELKIDETLVVGEDYLGWKSGGDENAIWTDNTRDGYIYSQVSGVDTEAGSIAWYESPYIYLAEGTNRIKVGVAGTMRTGWMQSGWNLADNEKVVFQITTDGVEYKDILTIDKDNCASLSNAEFVPFEAAFSDYAGQKVRLRIFIQRFTNGQTQFNRIYIEEKPAVDYPSGFKVASVDGGNVTLQWTAAEGAASYDVSYKLVSEDEWSETKNVAETSILLTNLQGLSSYQARIRSVGASQTSGWSDEISFATGASVPFDFVVADAADITMWKGYAGALTEDTELTEGGDIAVVQRSGFGGMQKYIRFMPYGTSSNSWLVSPAVSLGDDATKKFKANLTLFSIAKADAVTLKIVVANDGENFSSSNVIGTIELADLPESETTKDYSFDFTGFSGSIRLGYYIEGEGNDLTWLQFDKMGISTVEEPVVAHTWDFTAWSDETVDNLKADAAASATEGWSDVEKKGDAEAGKDPTDLSKDNCFWATVTPNSDGELEANGVVISELKGLQFTSYASARSLAIAVNYPTTSLGTYNGPSYLWLGGSKKDCFIIKNVKGGSVIKMGVESHKPAEARGVQLFISNEGSHGTQLKGTDGQDVAVPTVYAEQEWLVNSDATCDVIVYNTNGCHIYFIDAEISDIPTAIQSIENEKQLNNAIYNMAGQRVEKAVKGLYIINGKKVVVK